MLFFKEFGYARLSWLEVFIASGYIISIAGTLLILGSMLYFIHRKKHWPRHETSGSEQGDSVV
jgi:hypothetical protein